MNPWVVVTTVLAATILGCGGALLKMWQRQAVVEHTLYGQPGEKGLVDRFDALKEEVKVRDHATRGAMQSAVSELDESIRELQRTLPRRDR